MKTLFNIRHLMNHPGMRRVALFGGSFNPPHVGHVMVVAWMLATDRADEVWLLPAGAHPFGKPLASFADRVAMARAAIELFGARARVDEVEGEREGPTYTIQTVEILRARHPDTRFSLVVGTDVYAERDRWKSFDRLVALVDLVTVRRAGAPGARPPTDDADDPSPLFPDVSSTEVRARIAAGGRVDAIVPKAVLDRIEARGLYRSNGDR